MTNICVFSSSSDVDSVYSEAATQTGREIGSRGHNLVYGGSNLGLMGKVARAVQATGGEVYGFIHEIFKHSAEGEDKLTVARDLRERKALMEQNSDAYITLAGGFGTLDEMIEVIAIKQMRIHNKPLVLLNTEGFYNPLRSFFEGFIEKGFAKPENRQLYHIVGTPREAV